jgi:hypothetical protein
MDISSVTQIKDDWSKIPFTRIEVTKQKFCDLGGESIWSKMWDGTVQGCDCTNSWGLSMWKKHLQRDDACYDDDEYNCYYEPPRQAVLQEELEDMHICGFRGGDSFATLVRPDAKNKCPSGHTLCSKNTVA